MRSYTIFFFNDTATTEIYTLSLHDALPICRALDSAPRARAAARPHPAAARSARRRRSGRSRMRSRSEEHTSELQSRSDLVCRLLLEKKNKSRLARQQPTTGQGRKHVLLLPT